MGRKKIIDGTEKTERIMIRLTVSEKQEIKEILRIQGRSAANLLRDFIKNYINAYKILIEK
ncbi:MAG: hypothetical protein EVG15_06965 [Candidatus Acididesulfobacter diazotrophicus]|jgi:hypothetical protein|uniref:Ribbon-helix-helix protein, CopG family n=1 Tax=Candidatus Acididesulfobacter diazotrophicus TaxID=2597226 RepID=A0A519BLQ9_9DELT|nr:MAG: hypothetical protein EVG15_06965 [Candidatus Acididesulfobacter diazotrophicus]